MTDEPTFVLPFHGVEDFPPESAPLAVKSAQATSNGLIDPVMFGPNITGEFPNNDNEYEKYYSGAFSIGSVRLSGYSDADASTGQTGLFRASWSSSTYGSSTTVQPASVRSLFCIKS